MKGFIIFEREKNGDRLDIYFFEETSVEKLFSWIKENYAHAYNRDLVPAPKLLEPFEGYDPDDSEFGPYILTIVPITIPKQTKLLPLPF